MVDEQTVDTLRRIFKEHYFKHYDRVEVPKRIDEREFGYTPFGGSMIRHLGFKTGGELVATLVKEAPRGVYYSCAYYFDPILPMVEKGWKGADLVFDIDADDLDSPCKAEHDRWSCKKCGKLGKGLRPEKCDACRGNRIAELNWVCPRCLGAAKDHLMRLIDILMQDFGVSRKSLKPYFSGNMGYHLTLDEPVMEELGQQARTEVARYVAGIGLLPSTLGVSEHSSYEDLPSKLPVESEGGWRGRIAEYFKKMEFEGWNGTIGADVRSKIALIYGKLKYSGFKKLLDKAAKETGAAIDPSVTTDIHRIFRLPGTLHGETGLEKMKIDKLLAFDPFKDPVALGEEKIKVHVEHSPEFKIREEAYGPYENTEVVLPLAAATYLMGRGLARIGQNTF